MIRPSFGRRILSLLIDYALILAWMALLTLSTVIAWAISGQSTDWLELGVGGAQLLGFLLLVVPVGIYLFACEASSRHATVGKRVMRLRVVDETTTGAPAPWQVLVRTVVKLLPWEVAHFFVWQTIATVSADSLVFPAWVMVGLILADVIPLVYVGFVLFHRERRGPHDLAAGTRVIRIR